MQQLTLIADLNSWCHSWFEHVLQQLTFKTDIITGIDIWCTSWSWQLIQQLILTFDTQLILTSYATADTRLVHVSLTQSTSVENPQFVFFRTKQRYQYAVPHFSELSAIKCIAVSSFRKRGDNGKQWLLNYSSSSLSHWGVTWRRIMDLMRNVLKQKREDYGYFFFYLICSANIIE